MSLDKFALERAIAYEQLSRWIDKYKVDYAESSELADLKLARALVIEKDGDAKFLNPKEMQGALILYHIVTIEACLETGEANEIIEGETNYVYLLRSLGKHLDVLKKLNTNKITAFTNIVPDPELKVSEKILGRRELQYEVILKEIATLGFDKMNIPDSGKSIIKKACLHRTYSQTFGSLDAFLGAWKDGRRLDLFKMANNDKYKNY